MSDLAIAARDFMASVQQLRPKDHRPTGLVLDRLVAWTELRKSLRHLKLRGTKVILSVGLMGNDRILWSARLFETTGVFITLLGWDSKILGTPFAKELRIRLNAIRAEEPLVPGKELRVRIADLNTTVRVNALLQLIEDTERELRVAA